MSNPRPIVSKARHPPRVRSFTVSVPRGGEVSDLAHGWGQLLHAGTGAARVRSTGQQWVLPTGHALWIPPSQPHRIVCITEVAFRTLYFEPTQLPTLTPDCVVLQVSGLLRELVIAAAERAPLWPGDTPDGRLVAVLYDELARAAPATLALPMPHDPLARRFAERVLDDAADRSISEIARAVGTSRRTMERRFRSETGTSLGTWCRLARLHTALLGLAAGRPVPEVAEAAGYSSASAFGAAFRSVFGTTPARWRASHQLL